MRRLALLGLAIVAFVPLTTGARVADPVRHGTTPSCASRVASARLGHPSPRDDTELSRAQILGMIEDLRRTLLAKFGVADERAFESQLRVAAKIVVPVRFHVISAGDEGNLTKSQVNQQISTLQAAYSGLTGGVDTGISFRLESVDATSNAAWFRHPHKYEQAIKTALRRGGPGTLNLFTAAVGSDVLGFSTFPQWYRKRPQRDAVVIDYRSVPGGGLRHFNRGYTAVHEIGHWLGLFHTFENGCVSPGDAVDDTPYEAVPTEGCPLVKDTCPAPGQDPVHNFMDYGYDDCMNQFTEGQGRRIRTMWAAYRHG